MNVPIGLQLYSIRDYISQDVPGALKKVSGAGYNAVEFAGYYGYTAGDMRKLVESTGLQPLSSHVGIDQLERDPQGVLQYSLELGLKYVVCPGADLGSLATIEKTAEILNRAADIFTGKGISLGYHNHSAEFNKIDSRFALDILLEKTAGTGVFAQIDTCWVKYAGVDPLSYIRSIGRRCGLLHFKDLLMSDKDKGIAVGEGDVDFSGILQYICGTAEGIQGIIVEQEAFEGDPYKSLKISTVNINKTLDSLKYEGREK